MYSTVSYLPTAQYSLLKIMMAHYVTSTCSYLIYNLLLFSDHVNKINSLFFSLLL